MCTMVEVEKQEEEELGMDSLSSEKGRTWAKVVGS